ncbi:uncharacterized protein PHALS_06344 [Plasmopara halstedii]|uniref:Uncharacterized protein n=1 Tax=Plasmopara halstedii TaxID=4781 RepID=A0A0P1B2L7_PLAHL|nr:uncharacterized protein PHALS_06344 [Plasmopara halstedii]CEG48526.1 hypothetical protein PHALS_06344 [Plasmopara halstedii]|eukprot:XP_024584895.1 hypothetical protein PHALS_06344 [Plasmopara halstedii]
MICVDPFPRRMNEVNPARDRDFIQLSENMLADNPIALNVADAKNDTHTWLRLKLIAP